ncbi:MAG TPA: hypothetical protein VJB13_04895 [Candidatus Nanoarchaeia archaeon]|nr:hypothetical protein [Candidatus Nanoarchaeia archaeon]
MINLEQHLEEMANSVRGVKIKLIKKRFCDRPDLSKAYVARIVQAKPSISIEETRELGLSQIEYGWLTGYNR